MSLRRMFDALQQGATLEAASHESSLWKKDAAAPDYTPLAEASKEAMTQLVGLGEQQLAQARTQYEALEPFSRAYLEEQTAASREAREQARDYYDYMKEFRPLEREMLAEASKDRTAEQEAYRQRLEDYAATVTADPNEIYRQNRQAVEDQVGRAIVDVNQGFGRTLGQIGRAGLRYGLSSGALAKQAASTGIANAQQQAAAANLARTGAIQDVRQRAQTGYGLAQSTQQQMDAQRAQDWARRMDITGMGRGLIGASSGAYGLAGQLGMQGLQGGSLAGQQYMANMGAAAGTMGAGYQAQLGGLSNILNAQTSVYNTQANQGLDVGGLLSGGAQLYGAFMGSDRRLKDDIVWVGRDDNTGFALYEFHYKGDPTGKRYRGVMADEVEQVVPWAVATNEQGYKMVNYDMLGMEMVEVSHAA